LLAVSAHSRSEQNATFLMNRQNEFKRAAMSAKASGNMELAKKYLRMAKVCLVVEYCAVILIGHDTGLACLSVLYRPQGP